ncbi:MAG: replicative DNA helicase, partial [Clostridia bacterium]|nr:replicative DNA helicase [Clostridia bacterium]
MADNKDKNAGVKSARTMPNSFEAEQAVLAAMLLDAEVCDRFIPALSEDDFYSVSDKKIFNTIKELFNEGGAAVDAVGLVSRLNRKGELDSVGGVSGIESMVDTIPSTANADYYLSIVKRDSALRNIIRSCNDVIERAYSDDNADSVRAFAESKFFDLGVSGAEEGGLQHVSEPMSQLINKLNDIYTHKSASKGLLTGFYNLDSVLNGMLGGQILVLAARPGLGKTSFALNIVTNIAARNEGKVMAVFNLEMSATELAQRMLVNLTKISMQKLIRGEESNSDWEDIWNSVRAVNKSGIYIDDTVNVTPEDILHKCRTLRKKQGRLDLIVIDYLQLMGSSAKNSRASKQQEVAEISRGMKILAKELDVPVILLSQMSRDIEKREKDDKTPRLSDLRESGAIEQDADVVMFIHRSDDSLETSTKNVELIIAKHRNGPTDILNFIFDGDKMSFTPTTHKASAFKKVENKQE